MAKKFTVGELFKIYNKAEVSVDAIMEKRGKGEQHKLEKDYGKIFILRQRLSDLLEKSTVEVEIPDRELAIFTPGLTVIGCT